MSRVVGRVALLAEVHRLLAEGVAVALHGPTGIGKSALLDAVETGAGATVLRAAGAAAEQSMPYAALQDLLDQVPADVLASVPEETRKHLGPGLVGAPADDEVRHLLGRAFRQVLEAMSAEGRVLLLLDDAHWLDSGSAYVIGHARRRVPEVGIVATVGPTDGTGLDLTSLHRIDVPPLEVGDTIELLGRHGLPAHIAQRLHVESGGLPSLALALGGAVGTRPSLLGRPTPVPASIEHVLRERFLALPDGVRGTLCHVALLHRPTVRQLERAGRLDAEAEIRWAERAGLVSCDDQQVRFTPPALERVVVESTPAGCRAELHEELADVAPTVAEQLRHRALADPRPQAELAGALACAAEQCAAGGSRELATELYLLAADRAPCALTDDRVEWLATAIETGAPGNHAAFVHRALADLLVSPASPAQLVRVRLALVELAGSGVAAMDEVLAAALADAADDDRLVAMVLLQRARVALMESQPAAAARHAGRGVRLFRRVGDPAALADALTILAVATRWTGDPESPAHLAEAIELAGSEPVGTMHTSPAYIAARFALYDDRLDEAWSAFHSMLARVERGAGIDRLHVLRCLVEVGARSGRCAEVMEYAARAALIGEEFALDPHTGWFVSGLAELVGGDVERARTLATRGVVAAEERGDARYLQRHLLLLGQSHLRLGDAQSARAALVRIRELEERHGISDPTVNRWQGELVATLVALGELDEAADVLAATRAVLAGRALAEGMTAQLDRAAALLAGARGDVDEAIALLDASEQVCRRLGLTIDLGRALLTRAHVERRRRRAAAARACLEEAAEVFTGCQSRPWLAQVRAELVPDVDGALPEAVLERLTDTEARVAHEVALGASNREIAERLFLSVKTVEATLTRVYRKLEVRSRTQLATLVGGS
jgi:DNA-binding CsgD family transcriptional regulator/tetratricopeptide (TPR) repeat protein